MDRLLSASPNNSRVVLVGANIADHKLPDNPHVWYGIENMPAIAQAITAALKKLDTADASTFDSNLATFKQSLVLLEQKIREINKKYKVTPITTNLQNKAKNLNIPVVPVLETMPPGKTYQTWMIDQLNTLQLSLATATGK